MSKAFQCDNCLDCFPGSPEEVIDGKDICHSCVRVLKALGTIDPFVKTRVKLRSDKQVDWSRTDFPLHTGRHSQ